ncbi:MAG: crossover junction endodeoxyribonuclease RuvC [Planctomycetes bacterium HGW-Planctomycetes-1]|nr:MAG: crossover junction endodeoxyribonuclease RuvC [Planctomycetes bacterium HGW-Planctomycetes-1]
MGIDPGLQVCGYAVIEADRNRTKLLEAGICKTDSKKPLEKRLVQIAQDINSLLEKFGPACMAVEDLYSHYVHPKTAILMGHARGVILASACENGIDVRSFAATKIKKSLTGNGRASKMQMQRSIKSLLGLAKVPEPADVADAIAAALCCANSL